MSTCASPALGLHFGKVLLSTSCYAAAHPGEVMVKCELPYTTRMIALVKPLGQSSCMIRLSVALAPRLSLCIGWVEHTSKIEPLSQRTRKAALSGKSCLYKEEGKISEKKLVLPKGIGETHAT